MTDENHTLQPAYLLQAIRALEERLGAAESDLIDVQREEAPAAALQLGPGLRLHGDAKQRAAYFAALAQAQAAYAPIERTRTVKVQPRDKAPYEFDYAPLEEVISATRPALTAAGLAYSSYIANGEQGPELHTLLSHVEGGFMHMVEALPSVEKPQEMGSALTYHRRYQYQCLTGTSPEYDDDGNAASGNQVQGMQQRNRQPPAPAPKQQAAPAAAKPVADHKARHDAPKPAAPAPAQATRPASVPPPAATPPKAPEPPAPAEEPPPPRDEDSHMPVDVVDVGHQDMTGGADRSAEPAAQDQVDEIIKQAKRLRWDRLILNKYIADRIDPAKTHTTLTFADAAALIPMLEKQVPNA